MTPSVLQKMTFQLLLIMQGKPSAGGEEISWTSERLTGLSFSSLLVQSYAIF